jgi:PAS domain S-box-containing protein
MPDNMPYGLDLIRPLLDASLDGVIVTDRQGSIVVFNPAAEIMFGRSSSDVIGRPVGAVVVPAHLRGRHETAMVRRLAGTADTTNRQRFETEGMRADGSIFPVELTVTELLLTGGERLMVAYLRDITARQQLRISEERYRLAIRGANDGIFEWDVEHGTAFYSERLEEIVGRRASDLGGSITAWHDHVHPDDLEALKEETRRLLRGEIQTIAMEYRIRRSDGEERWIQVTAATARDAAGRVLRVGGSIGDITERKRSAAEIENQREALYQSEKLSALGSLLAGVAHELNNPLSIVVGHAQMLKETAEGTAFAERASKIEAAAARCARIARTFLAMARQRQPARRRVALERVIEDALNLLDYNLRSAGIVVERRYAPDLPAVNADPDQINQVISNLIVNAQQALAGRSVPGRIVIILARSGDGQWLEASIADNGPGIPANLRRRVFEPFFTTKPPGHTPGSGTGIGLAVSHGIVTAHGGRLDVEEAPGGGACFILRLPIGGGIVAETMDGQATTAIQPPTAGQHVLVVDDESGVADLLAEILRADGLQVVVAANGFDALERIAQMPFAAILTDLRMPGLDGRSLFRRLRDEQPELARRIIFVTGDMLSADIATFVRDSGQPCLEKPFSPADLRAAVSQIIDRNQSRTIPAP